MNRTNDEIVAIKIIGERIHQKKVYLANISKDLEQTDEDILHIQQEIQHCKPLKVQKRRHSNRTQWLHVNLTT